MDGYERVNRDEKSNKPAWFALKAKLLLPKREEVAAAAMTKKKKKACE
jgi:hypothetical protein